MKHIFNYILSFAAGAVLLGACQQDELIPSKDNFKDYKGVTGDFAYIEGATLPQFDAVEGLAKTTPDGWDGELSKTFNVALTAPQKEAVVVTIGLNDKAIDNAALPFPEGALSWDDEVIIPAGEKSVEVNASVSDFSGLDGISTYQAVFCITAVSGELKVSTNSNKSILTLNTKTIDPTKNFITVTPVIRTFSIRNYTNETQGDRINATIAVAGSQEAYKGATVHFEVDNSLIAAYNEANGTSHVAVPDGLVKITDAEIAAGATSASAQVAIDNGDRALLSADETGYLIPIVAKSTSEGVLSDPPVSYLTINTATYDYASDQFACLYWGNKEAACWYKFPKGVDISNGYTYVFYMFIDKNVGQQRVGNFADASENWINMLRLGQRGNGEEIEWWVGPNGHRKNLYAAVSAGAWHQIGLVWNPSNRQFKLYVDGSRKAVTTIDQSEMSAFASGTFQGIEFANSWGDSWRSSFDGRIMNISIWQGDISALYGRYNLLTMYISKTEVSPYGTYYGLQAWWPMMDGTGAICKSSIGDLGDIDFTRATRCNDEVNFVEFNAAPYLQWVSDENNKK